MKVWIVTHKSRPPQHPVGGEKMGEMITPAAGRVHVHARTHLKEPCTGAKIRAKNTVWHLVWSPQRAELGHAAPTAQHHGDGGHGHTWDANEADEENRCARLLIGISCVQV